MVKVRSTCKAYLFKEVLTSTSRGRWAAKLCPSLQRKPSANNNKWAWVATASSNWASNSHLEATKTTRHLLQPTKDTCSRAEAASSHLQDWTLLNRANSSSIICPSPALQANPEHPHLPLSSSQHSCTSFKTSPPSSQVVASFRWCSLTSDTHFSRDSSLSSSSKLSSMHRGSKVLTCHKTERTGRLKTTFSTDINESESAMV